MGGGTTSGATSERTVVRQASPDVDGTGSRDVYMSRKDAAAARDLSAAAAACAAASSTVTQRGRRRRVRSEIEFNISNLCYK